MNIYNLSGLNKDEDADTKVNQGVYAMAKNIFQIFGKRIHLLNKNFDLVFGNMWTGFGGSTQK